LNPIVVQLLVLCGDVIFAAGFTVIVTVNGAPNKQVPEAGVTLKVAVVGLTVVLVSVLVTVAVPVPDTPPVVPVPSVGVAHLYVVPAGMTPVGVYEKATVLQVTPVCAVIFATGLTVTVTVNGAPVVHVPDVGVTL
jgi:hypothetical protein